MLYVLPETAGDIIVVQATDTLTASDYQETFLPIMEEKIATHGGVRCLLYLDHGFQGWETGALWEDAKFAASHSNDFIRIAIVGGADWLDWISTLSKLFIRGEAKHFAENQFLQALHWIDEG